MKKYLSLLLAMLMLVSSVGFSAFATEPCKVHTAGASEKVYPTCTEYGYTITKCKVCGTEIVRTYDEEPLPHQFYKVEYVEVEGQKGAYIKKSTCTRTYRGKEGICGATTIEKENGSDVIYYAVSFVNNRVANDTTKSVNGVDLISSFKEETLASYYVKSGTVGEYKAGAPALGKTAQFGAHKFDGWTTNENLVISDSYDSSVYAKLDAPVNGPITFYPVFVGQEVSYPVTFFSHEGKLTNTINIVHGGSAYYRVNGNPSGGFYNEPTKAEDLKNYYDFAGWSVNMDAEIGLSTLSLEKVPVYDVTNYYSVYKPSAKNYRVEFCTYKMATINTFDDVKLGSNLLTDETEIEVNGKKTTVAAAIAEFNKASSLIKPSTDTYNYVWTGKWRIVLGTDENGNAILGNTVSLDEFEIYSEDDYYELTDKNGNVVTATRNSVVQQLDHNGVAQDLKKVKRDEPIKVIRLVPEYDSRLIVYHVGVKMSIPAKDTGKEDPDYYLGGAAVRVFDYNGNIVASGKTDADGIFRCTLNYIPGRFYTVKITTADSKYLGEASITRPFKLSENGDAYEEAMLINVCNVEMYLNPEYTTSCSCIHHNPLIQPIWVRILNILHSLFNVRYECCYDMYSTIGSLLDYTA